MRGKLKSLDLIDKKALIESKLTTLSILKQCELIGLSRSSFYYVPVVDETKEAIKEHMRSTHKEIPIYGSAKVQQQLLDDGIDVSLNTVEKYWQEGGYKALLVVRPVNTSIPVKAHKKYPYRLDGLAITKANQVWPTLMISVNELHQKAHLHHLDIR